MTKQFCLPSKEQLSISDLKSGRFLNMLWFLDKLFIQVYDRLCNHSSFRAFSSCCFADTAFSKVDTRAKRSHLPHGCTQCVCIIFNNLYCPFLNQNWPDNIIDDKRENTHSDEDDSTSHNANNLSFIFHLYWFSREKVLRGSTFPSLCYV